MNGNRIRFAIIGISFLLFGLGASSPAQSDTSYPLMGPGEHRQMMAYEYDHGRRMAENVGTSGHMPCGGWGPDVKGYGQMGPGMMGYGHMGRSMMGGMWAIMQLDLNDTQEKGIREIHSRLRRENWARMGDMMDHQDKLAELHAADVPDAKAIGAVYAAIFDIKRQKIESMVGAQNEMRALLTDEQRQALKGEMRRSRRHMRGYDYMQ